MSKKHPSTPAPLAPSQQKRNSGKTRGDDRNLVEIDEAFKEAEFEDKLWLFWNRNKSYIITAILAAFFATIAVQGVHVYRKNRLLAVQEEFAAATTGEQKIAFATTHPGNPLAAIALLSAADEQYTAQSFDRAASLYADAAIAAAKTPELKARATLGQGIALARGGNVSQAMDVLQALAGDTSAADAFRAQAAYHFATLALENGQTDRARSSLQSILALRYAGPWREQAEDLLRTKPQLQPES